MLRYLHLENFRAFGEATTIPLAPITLLFGENSAGKTSILHALTLLKQTAQSDDHHAAIVTRDANGLVDLGTYADLVFDHDPSRTLRLGIGVTEQTAGAGGPRARGATYRHKTNCLGRHWAFGICPHTGDPRREEIAIGDAATGAPIATLHRLPVRRTSRRRSADALDNAIGPHEQFTLRRGSLDPVGLAELVQIWADHAEGAAELIRAAIEMTRERVRDAKPDARTALRARLEALTTFHRIARRSCTRTAMADLVRHFEPATVLHGLFCSERVADELSAGAYLAEARSRLGAKGKAALRLLRRHPLLQLRDLLGRADQLARHALQGYIPIGPFRVPASRVYTYSGTRPLHVGRSGELVADLLHRDPECLDRTNQWLDAFAVGYRIDLRRLGKKRSDVFEVRLVDQQRRPAVDHAFVDVGFGVSQILPIVVQCVATRDRIISIEQPEVHIHPRLQAEVGGLLADCVKRNGHQFLVETHSEHLVLRLLKLIRVGELDPSDVAVIHVRRGPRGSIAERIEIEPDGSFTRDWPGGFFPERLKELL